MPRLLKTRAPSGDRSEDYAWKVVRALRDSLRLARLRNRNLNRRYEALRARNAELEGRR